MFQFLGHQHRAVHPQRQGLAQHFLGRVVAKRKRCNFAPHPFTEVKRRFQRVGTKDVHHQPGRATLGFQLFGIHAKIPGRNFRIEYLLKTNEYVHALE